MSPKGIMSSEKARFLLGYYGPRNNLEEWGSQLLHGRSLQYASAQQFCIVFVEYENTGIAL